MSQRNAYARPHADQTDVSLSQLGCILGLVSIIVVAIALIMHSVFVSGLALIAALGAISFTCGGLVRMFLGREPAGALARTLVGLVTAGITVFAVVTPLLVPA